MGFYEGIDTLGHEQVSFFQDKHSGLKAIVAIHDTTLGPSLGGCRMYHYKSEEEALTDVLRLSRGMTFKAAVAGLPLGGGKAVIIGDPKQHKSESLFRAFGKCVDALGGRYITAEDVGTDVDDMEYIYMETPYVTGVDKAHGGSGNPAPFTAYGVLQGIKAAVEYKYQTQSLKGLHFTIQGLGQVGWELTSLLKREEARVTATDIDKAVCQKAKQEFGIEIVDPNEIFDVPCDLFAPCALGGVINDNTVERLKCKIVGGAANNQLKEERHGDLLTKRGILYVPDFVINAGGLINVFVELEGYSRTRAMRICHRIHDNCKQIFEISEKERMPTHIAADKVAQRRIDMLSQVKARFNVYPREKFDKRRGSLGLA